MHNKLFAIPSLFLLIALGLPPAGLGAEDTLALGEIVVTATRTDGQILSSPGHVTVLDAERISRSGAGDLAELLDTAAGVRINDYGAEGATKSISIRGSASAQVLILVNGVRLNDSRQGGANLAEIPLDNIERIEIIRGGFSALYGADAVAGVVNIITRKKADGSLKLKLENRSYLPRAAVEVSEGPTETQVAADGLELADGQKVSVQYSRKLDEADLVSSGSFTRAANGFVWKDDEYINDYRRRINADLLGADGYLSLTSPLGAGTLGANGSIAYQDVGVPGSIYTGAFNTISSDARQKTLSARGELFYDSDRFLFSDLLSLKVKGFYKYSSTSFDNPPAAASVHRLHSFGLDGLQEFAALELLSLVYGGNLTVDIVDSTQLGEKRRISGGVFLEAPLYPLPGLSIVPVVRYDLYSDFPASFTFKLSGVYRIGDMLALKLSAGTSYRAPTLNDLYWPNDGFSQGNPNLSPESGYSGEAGLSVLTDRVRLDAYAFLRYLVDAIQWTETSPWFWEPTNIGRLLYPGAELESAVNLVDAVWLEGSYAFLYSFVLESATTTYTWADDKRAPYAPVHELSATVAYRGAKLTAQLSGRYVGRVFSDAANTTAIEPYFVLDASLGFRPNEALQLRASVDNLLNTTYEVLTDYIAPPISLRVAAELSL